MKLSSFIKTGLLGLAQAAACARPPKGHEWHPPVSGDSRSPCPGLNVMANHGWLPRSGKDIDLAKLQHAVVGAYNYAPDSFDGAFQQALDLNVTTTGNRLTFHLSDLAKHDAVEFDGSLSRNDFFFGDTLHFNPAIWGTVAHNLGLNDKKSGKYVTVETAAKARAARVRDAMRVNPTFNASANQMQGSPGTTALYLTTLWDDKADGAQKSWIKSFFVDERLPYAEGYKVREVQRGNSSIFAIFERIQAVKVET